MLRSIKAAPATRRTPAPITLAGMPDERAMREAVDLGAAGWMHKGGHFVDDLLDAARRTCPDVSTSPPSPN